MMTNIEQSENKIDEHDLIGQRKQKLLAWRETGRAYTNDFHRNALAEELQQEYGAFDHDALENVHKEVKIAGRMMLRRLMGKASFCHIQDMSGRIQIYL